VEGGDVPGSLPNIVVGADGSDASAEALRWAIRQAKLTGAEVRVATGYTLPVTIFVAPTYAEIDYERDAVEAQLTTIEKATQGLRDVPMTTTVIETRPARLLTEMARDADLLVVGAHGPGGFRGMHLGSVANFCVHHAPCPVVVVRSPED
jgi:nucleotide-binding universal stress UspA family protein